MASRSSQLTLGFASPIDGEAGATIVYDVVDDRVVRVVTTGRGTFRSAVESRHTPVASAGAFDDAAGAFDYGWLRSASWPQVTEPRSTLSIADLFCGSGGLSLGAWEAARAMQLELRPSLAIDNDPDAVGVYRDNFEPHVSFCAGIETLVGDTVGAPTSDQERVLQRSLAAIDLLVAGPPCQGHSDLNNHTRRDDPRNALISRVIRFVELFEPRHVVIENVQGIRHDRSGAFQVAQNDLRRLGYQTVDLLLEGSEIGLPQRRRRCFLIASKSTVGCHSRILDLHRSVPKSFDWACRDLEGQHSSAVFDTSAKVYAENQRRMDFLIENDLYDLPNEERPDCHRLKKHDYQSVYGRLRPDLPTPTITTGFGSPGQGRYTHPRYARTITPHEAARLQFIPDFFVFRLEKRKRLQKLIGNSVPSKLAFAVILDLLAHE